MNSKEIFTDFSNNNNSTDNLLKNKGAVSFYSGAKLFITGGTGFVGKAIIEKLLRTCEELDTIYVLLRTKRGAGVEQRYKELLKHVVYDNIRAKKPELLNKIQIVPGDVSLPNLGLSEEDIQTLTDNVTILIHSAATVRFVEPLSVALNLNTRGTKNIIDLAYKMKNLKSLVYVSTAYSNSNRPSINEIVYPAPHDPDALLQCSKILPSETIDMFGPLLIGTQPNTYTFTKQLAENLIRQCYGKLPVTIVRPSIITSACNEPLPGWVDNIGGVNGSIMEIMKGTLRTAYVCHPHLIVDYIPVDYVVNTCIAAAWHHTTYESNDITVYNCTSGQINPMTWNQLINTAVKIGREFPTKYVTMYPNFKFTSNRSVNSFWQYSTQVIPSYLLDLVMRLQGKKPSMMRTLHRVRAALSDAEFFAQREWEFGNENMKSLTNALKIYGEDVYLPTDLNNVDIKSYTERFILGIREYLLKDTIESLPEAKMKMRRLFVMYNFLRLLSGYCFLKFFMDRLNIRKMMDKIK